MSALGDLIFALNVNHSAFYIPQSLGKDREYNIVAALSVCASTSCRGHNSKTTRVINKQLDLDLTE